MNALLEQINAAARAFVEFALPMLIQSGLLIVVLLLADMLLRKKVKAVFRYWIWMLVLVKLVLPTSLSSPLSLGYLFGEKLTYQDLARTTSVLESVKPAPADIPPGISPIYIKPNTFVKPTVPVIPGVEQVAAEPAKSPTMPVPTTPLSWQGIVFLVWLAVVIAMGLLLLQRALFVRGLVAQAKKASGLMNDELAFCCASMKIKRKVVLKVSPNATTPSVCGLIRPVILVPWNLMSTLGTSRIRTVLMHELAHIKRADLWVNLAQTILQIVYFYNPLLWLANCVIRRIREQAVDEAVLVAMGTRAQRYPQTLVDVAKLTFKRPALSLRLIGVVESKSALAGRIKHILARPMPKSAKLGIAGVLAIFISAAILLPMARAREAVFASQGGPLNIRLTGVRPDGSDDIYDGNGNKIAENTFANIAKDWGQDQQHRTFIFELPKTEESILFSPFLKIKPAGEKRGLGTGQHPLLYYSAGKLMYSVGVRFPRTYKKVIERRIRQVDLTLPYYYGQRGAADFAFTGPFTAGNTLKANRGADCELTAKKDRLDFSNEPAAFFRISSKTRFDPDSVLVYDTSGRRCLPELEGGRSGSYGSDYRFRAEGLTLNSITYVTVGEKPYEAVFKNVVVSYPDRPVPERLEFLDEMCERLDLMGFSGGRLLNNYTFENPADAAKVIDIVRGYSFVMKVFRAIKYSDSGIELSNLDSQAQQKVRSAAARWAKAGHPKIREMGIRLGLVGGWPEFMDMALDWLEQDVIVYDMIGRAYRGLEEGAKEQIASEVQSYPIALNSEQAERFKKVILRTESPRLGMRLFGLFWRADEDLTYRICWDLVEDDRPWIWWPAMRWLVNRCNEKLRPFENLSEKIQKRLILVHEARDGSSRLFKVSSSGRDYDTLAKEAYSMLPAMFAARLARMDSRTCNEVRQVMVKHLNGEIATKAMIDFLREISAESYQLFWVGDSFYFGTCCSTTYYIARHINSLNDLDIANLGKYGTREIYEDIPRDISRLKQLIADTLQWYDGRSGAGHEGGLAKEVGAVNKAEKQAVSLEHFIGKFAIAQNPDTAVFEITKEGDVFIFSYLSGLKFETAMFLKGLEGRKFKMEKDGDNLKFGDPRYRFRVRYDAAEDRYILDKLGMRGEVRDAVTWQLAEFVKISARKLAVKTDVHIEVEPVGTYADNPRAAISAIIEQLKSAKYVHSGRGSAHVVEVHSSSSYQSSTRTEKILDFKFKGELSRSDAFTFEKDKRGDFECSWTVGPMSSVRYNADEKATVQARPFSRFYRELGYDFHPQTFPRIFQMPIVEFLERMVKQPQLRLKVARESKDVVRIVSEYKKEKSEQKLIMMLINGADDMRLSSWEYTVKDSTEDGTGARRSRLQLRWRKYAGLWYISEAISGGAGVYDGLRSEGRTTVTIREFTPNVEIEDKEFTLDGLDIRPGASVNDLILETTYKYAGSKGDAADKLRRLSRAAQMYANDYDNKFPDTMQQLKQFLDETELKWLLENVRYLGKGKTVLDNPEIPLAYDETILEAEQGRGTNVLFVSGIVSFRAQEQLKKLGITAGPKTDVQVEDMKGRIAHVPEQVQAIDELLQEWFEACVAGDLESMKSAYSPDYQLFGRDMRQINELLGMNPSWQLSLLAAMWDKEKAMAVSGALEHGDPKVGGPMVLVWTFNNSEGRWGIIDIDLEELEGLQLENSRFMQKHPNAQVWFDNPDLNAPKMRRKTDLQVEVEEGGQKPDSALTTETNEKPDYGELSAKGVVRRFMAVILSGGEERISPFVSPSMPVEKIKDIQKLDSAQDLKIVKVYYAGGKNALAITSVFKISWARKRFLFFRLVRRNADWRIYDIDFIKLDKYKQEIEKFYTIYGDIQGELEDKPSKLTFRVVPNIDDGRQPALSKQEFERYCQDLQALGPVAGGKEYRWVATKEKLTGNLPLAAYDGQGYILLSSHAPYVMSLAEDWALQRVCTGQDNKGRPMVSIWFDHKGGEIFYKLTKENMENSLAILIDDKVISAPTIKSPIPSGAIIAGNFSELDVEKMAIALQIGMSSGAKRIVQVERGAKGGGLTVFESYFPDDAEAGRKLDQWWENRGRNRLDDEEFFELFRKGLRRSTVKYKGNFLMQHIGGGYIWHKDPDDQRAIDIVYHASFSPEYKYYSVYSGLSVANPKSEKVLKRLVDLAMEYHQLGRVLWGVKQSKQEVQFMALLEPYLRASDPENRERADSVTKALRGEIEADKLEREWSQRQKTERTIREFGDELPKIKKTFLSGTSEDRLKAIDFIKRNAVTLTFDQGFIRALEACSQDSNANVRAGAANFLGYNYIWGKDIEPKEVIGILLRLSQDENRQVRYNTVYSGLSVVNEKDAKVIKRLIELALTDHENNLYGRIIWGLRGPMRSNRKLVEQILAEQLDEVKSDLHKAASLYFLYKELFNTEPPSAWDLEDAASHYSSEVFGINLSPQEPFRPENKDALWEEFYGNLPDNIDVQRFPVDDNRKIVILVKVQGHEARDTVMKVIENNPRLRTGQAIPLEPRMQLYFEELQTIKSGQNSNFSNQSEEPSKDKTAVAEDASAAETTVEPEKTRGGISGTVLNSTTAEPIAGAYVGVGDFGDSGGSNYSRHREQGFHDKTKTDEKGRFELDGLIFTDDHPYLKYHPLVVTHPDFVRHDEKIKLLKNEPEPDVRVSLRPAATIDVTIVDADGNPIKGHWLMRLEALDGRRFIPLSSDPHLSSFASNIWAHWPDMRKNMGISQGFAFTELDTGEYLIEAIRIHLVDKPTPQNIWEPTVTYHGLIPSIEIQAGQTKQIQLPHQDHQTRLTIIPPEFPEVLLEKLKRSSQMPTMCLISRSPGIMLWDDGKIRHIEDQRFGRIDQKRFFRGFFSQGKPLTINNLPPGPYSFFTLAVYGNVAGYLIGARTNLDKGDEKTIDIPWRQPTGPSMFGPNRSFDYPVKLEDRDYSVAELCEIMTDITLSNPRIIADSSIKDEKLRFGINGMSIWDVLEKLYLDKGWKVEEGEEKTLIIKPAEKSNMSLKIPEVAKEARGEPEGSDEIVGRVVDEMGNAIASAQVAISTEKIGVKISNGKLLPLGRDNIDSKIVQTDSQGTFNFGLKISDGFDLIVAHDSGFAQIGSEGLDAPYEIRIRPWGRIEGRITENRKATEDNVALWLLPNSTWFVRRQDCYYETKCDGIGRFVFDKVPPIWVEVGYLVPTEEASFSYTCRTPVEVKAGQTVEVILGGSGRPVVGRFVAPDGYDKSIYFGQSLGSLNTVHLQKPLPGNYDRMTKRQQQLWYEEWRKTAEYRKYRDAVWHDKNRRHYSFGLNEDGSFRVEDVIAGKYQFTVWVEERFTGRSPPEEIASYYGTIEVPEIPGGRSNEPLDVGELELTMYNPLQVGDMAPMFEAETLDGKGLKLTDYRGKFVLLSFWQPVSHPERQQIHELYDAYSANGSLKIIGLGGNDTLEEVNNYVQEYSIPWPQIFIGEELQSSIAKNYNLPGIPLIFLIGPDGRIVAKNLRGEKLKSTVNEIIRAANAKRISVPVDIEGVVAASAESEVAAREDGPRITFESQVCNLGQVAPGTKHIREFKFTNTGNALLKITRIRSACACATSQLTKKDYAPGESGTLKVTYQSGTGAIRVAKSVLVYNNTSVNPVKLTIKAEIVVKVAHEPKRLSLLLDKENAGCPAITLTSLDNQPFSITAFKSTGDFITAEFSSSVKDKSLVIQPKVNIEKLRKSLRGQIEIGLTHPECKKLTITYDTLPEFKFNPRVVYIRNAQSQKPVTKKVSILSNYNEDFEIESTSSRKEIVKVLSQKKVNDGFQFELQITPPSPPESKRRVFTDTFSVRLKGGQVLSLTCYGIYPKEPSEKNEVSIQKNDAPDDVEETGEKFSQLMGADLPDSAQNVKFLSGSFEAASKTFTKFDIPLSDLKSLLTKSDKLPDFPDLHKNPKIQKDMDAVYRDFNIEWWKSDELESPVCAAWIKSNRIKGNPEDWMVNILNMCCSQLNNNLMRVYISLYSDSPQGIPKINPDMEREIADPRVWSQELAAALFEAVRANDNKTLKALIVDKGLLSTLQGYRTDFDFSSLKKMVHYQKANHCFVIVSPIRHKEIKDSNREIQISFQLEANTWKAHSIETTGIGAMDDLLKEDGFNVFSKVEITREFPDTSQPNFANNSTLQVDVEDSSKPAIEIESWLLVVSEEFLEDIGFKTNSINTDGKFKPAVAESTDSSISETCSFILNDPNVSFLLKAIQAHEDSVALITPKVTVFDGKEADFNIHNQVNYISGYAEPNLPSGEPEPKRDFVKIGTWWKVNPKITPDNKNILLDVDFKQANLLGYEECMYKEKYPYKIPQTEVVSCETRLLVPDGRTVLICGQKIAAEKDGRKVQKELFVLIKAEKVDVLSNESRPPVDVEGLGTSTNMETQPLAFGPVVECVVHAIDTEKDSFIDFDTGKFFNTPKKRWLLFDFDVHNVSHRVEWAKKTGADAAVRYSSGGARLLAMLWSYDLAAKKVEPDDWQNLRPEQAVQYLSKATHFVEDDLGHGDIRQEPPDTTHIFKTREGRVGIIQIVGFTNDPMGVKIRYKMIQKESTGKANMQVAGLKRSS